MSGAEDLAISEAEVGSGMPTDPSELKRLLTAAEVLRLHIEGHMTIEDACAAAGISRATYSRWVKDGVFAPLIAAYLGPLQLQIQSQALDGIREAITWLTDVAKGQGGPKATNFDRMAAIKFLWGELAKPLLTAAPVAEPKPPETEDEGKKYLQEPPPWADVKPGETITKTETVTRSPEPVDVTPPGEPAEV